MLGGANYTHVDEETYELSDLQVKVMYDLMKKYPPKMFQKSAVNMLVKNTRDIQCPSCGSENVFVESKQLRSADEASSKLYTCIDCGNHWRKG